MKIPVIFLSCFYCLSLHASNDLNSSEKMEPLKLTVGNPTFTHVLTYEKKANEGPPEKTAMHYYDNGIYKIVTADGVGNYGLYAISGAKAGSSYVITHLPLPLPGVDVQSRRQELLISTRNKLFKQSEFALKSRDVFSRFGSLETNYHYLESSTNIE